jgi:hypothetical protein
MANIFSDILKGMGKGMTQYGRNMGQRLGLIELASRVKRVNPEDYATTEEYQRALNQSNVAYQRLQQEIETPTYTGLDKLLGISPEEVRTIRSAENVLSPQQGAKDILSVAPMVVTGGTPAGLGWKGLPIAAGMGAARGSAGHVASSMPGKELEGIGKTAGISALLETLGYGAGEAASAYRNKLATNETTGGKVSKKLSDMSDDLKTTAYKKKIGVAPTAKQGKYDLVRDSRNLASSEGRKINNADDLYQFSDEIFNKYGDTASKMTQAADDMGATVSTSKLIKPLQEKMRSLKFSEDKAAYQSVIDQIKSAAGGSKYITASELLELRRQMGPKGNWNQLTPTAEQTTAKIWEEAYNIANKTLDDTLTQAGISGFKDVNKKLATAIEQQNWARRALASRSGAQVWTDMAQDATMFGTALGSGPGGLAGFAVSKLLQGQSENIAAGALDVGAKAIDSASGFGGPAASLLKGAGTAAQFTSPYVGAIRGVEEQPRQDQPPQQVGQPASMQPQTQYGQLQSQEGLYPGAQTDGYVGPTVGMSGSTGGLGQGGELKQLLAMGILSGEVSASDATAILGLLGLDRPSYNYLQGDTVNQGALINAVLGGELGVTEAKWLTEMLTPENERLNVAIDELERLYAPGTGQSLSRGTKTTGLGGLVSKATTAGKKITSQEYADRLEAYNQQRAIAVGMINKAREAGVLNEGEYEVMINNMPNEWTSEKVAQEWFNNIRKMLTGAKASGSQDSSALYEVLGL